MQRDAHFSGVYAALRAKGQRHGQALRHIGDRLLRILVAMLRHRTCYDPSRIRQGLVVQMPVIMCNAARKPVGLSIRFGVSASYIICGAQVAHYTFCPPLLNLCPRNGRRIPHVEEAQEPKLGMREFGFYLACGFNKLPYPFIPK